MTHKDISEELGLVNLEMRAGKRRADALRNLAERVGEAELKKLVAILVQADRFGVSVAESLRTHSDLCGCAAARKPKKGPPRWASSWFSDLFLHFTLDAGGLRRPGAAAAFQEFVPDDEEFRK